MLLIFIMLSILRRERVTAAITSSAFSKSAKSLPTLSSKLSDGIASRALRCREFIDSSPEPYHCVDSASKILISNGFKKIEAFNYSLERGGKYFFTKGGSTIVSFVVGENYSPGGSFKVIGAHTDSPNLKLKPSTKRSASNLIQLNVECYGGGLWHTWFDRDLSIAGRVIIRSESSSSDASNLQFSSRLLHVRRPVLRIPSLCIHLRTPDEREVLKINKEDHLAPILCDEVKEALSKPLPTIAQTSISGDESSNITTTSASSTTSVVELKSQSDDDWASNHNPQLLNLIATELGCKEEQIADFDLSLFDTQLAAAGGLQGEYIFSSRIDNLASCFVALEALVQHAADSSSGGRSTPRQQQEQEEKKEEGEGSEGGQASTVNDTGEKFRASSTTGVSLVALFDHEEVGSGSTVGAGSTIMADAIRDINAFFCQDKSPLQQQQLLSESIRKSLVLSSDMAHAVHPNYAAKHDKAHSPRMNAGVVIKSNSNQRYATSGVSGFLIRELARRIGSPIQEFVVRNDCPCGSTIGPIISQNTGIRAVDVGMPQLSMHSVREMMGASDLTHAYELYTSFFSQFEEVDSSLQDIDN